MEEPTLLQIALQAADAGDAGHWPTVAGILADAYREKCIEADTMRQHHQNAEAVLAEERTLSDMLAGAIMREYSVEDALKRYRDGLANDYDKARVSVYLSNDQGHGRLPATNDNEKHNGGGRG